MSGPEDYAKKSLGPEEYAKVVLKDHMQNDGGCYCGREVVGSSHAEHLIDELKGAGLRISFYDNTEAANRERKQNNAGG